ncbi:MAG: 3-phosphoshikimate 1-carboxyvinyltransferase [Ferruginibacter sp.]
MIRILAIMKRVVKPGNVSGVINAPVSKSAMQRALALALLHKGKTLIHNPGNSNDDRAAMDIIQSLGAMLEKKEQLLEIDSDGVDPVSNTINCGESGLSIRMFTPIASLSRRQITVTGTGSLLKRPMNFFDEVLPQLGVQASSNAGFLPLKVEGPLCASEITVDGSLSSQFLTGLLIALAASATVNTLIHVKDLKSRPYIDLTMQMMEHFGYRVVNNQYQSFEIFPKPAEQKPVIEYTVEGDWSGAAFLLVSGAVAGDVSVTGLDVFSAQADKAVLHALMDAGAIMSITAEKITVRKNHLKAFHFDAGDCPDLFPPLVALAAYCDGTSVIEGAGRLLHKESNRALTLQEEFGKLGVKIKLQDDLMIIEAPEKIKGANTFSHHDHRIAMALATAALGAVSEVEIEGAEAVNKSYPAFFDDIEKLGAVVV